MQLIYALYFMVKVVMFLWDGCIIIYAYCISLESNAVARTFLPRFMETKHRRAPKLLDVYVSPSHEQRLTNNTACLTGVSGGKARSIATFIVQLSS